jgi:hypothetical protein
LILFDLICPENLNSCSVRALLNTIVRGSFVVLATVGLLALLMCAQKESSAAVPYLMTFSTVDNAKEANPSVAFYPALKKALKKRKFKLEHVCPATDSTARRVLEEYGAMFLVNNDVKPPPVCVFLSGQEVEEFQARAGFASETIADSTIELQPAAMKAYLKARDEAIKEGLDITPRGGPEAARRSYADSESLWNTRFLPALEYWTAQGRLTATEADNLRALPLQAQISQVLDLEQKGIFFSKDLSKSILYSIAAPGSSQHLAMLALDVTEFQTERVRQILAEHGWFQTVLSDLPHFTYLGLKEKDLPKHGLKSVEVDGQVFWIPNVDHAEPSTPN